MAVVMALRANSLNAYFSTGPNVGIPSDTTRVASSANSDSNNLSGGLIDLTTTNSKFLEFVGWGNSGESRAFSVLCRIKSNYTGNPASNNLLFQLGLGRNGVGPYFEVWHSTSSVLTAFCRNEAASTILSSANLGTASLTANTYYDIVITFTGTNSASGAKGYLDAVNTGSATASGSLTSSWKSSYFNPIMIGCGQDVVTSNFKLDEFVIFDTAIDPTSVQLVSGTGSLNGASRTSLVNASNIDKTVFTDPLIANVKNGTTYTFQGSSQTGTLVTGGLFRNPNLDGT
jgi:hypothetical protein